MQAPKSYQIKRSGIDDAGLGMYLMESAKKDERIAVYYGEIIDKRRKDKSDSAYIVEISKMSFWMVSIYSAPANT